MSAIRLRRSGRHTGPRTEDTTAGAPQAAARHALPLVGRIGLTPPPPAPRPQRSRPNTVSGRGVPGCRCDECKYGRRPGADAVLYAGPDAMLLLIAAAIRDGRYEDIDAYAEEEAPRKIHVPAIAEARRIDRCIESVMRRVQAVAAERRAA